jgi:glucoamylase
MFANTGSARTGLDANTVLASIHTYDSEAGCDAVTFQPCSDKALVNLVRFVDTWRNGAYGINAPFENNRSTGIAVGRYREDIYQMRNVRISWFKQPGDID